MSRRRLLLAIPFALGCAFALLLLTVGLSAWAACAATASLVFAPWRFRLRWAQALIAALLAAVLSKSMLIQLSSRQSELMRQGTLATDECAVIYLFGLAMGAGGFVAGYPEAAREHLGLYWDGPADRVISSDFPMASAKVRSALAALAGTARTSGKAAHLERRRLTFAPGKDPTNVVLALDPLELSADAAVNADGSVTITAVGTVPVSYPPHARTRLFTFQGVEVVVEEGLFEALQRRGWLHPFRASYVWTF